MSVYTYRSSSHAGFGFRVDADTKLKFSFAEDTVVENIEHARLCEVYVKEGQLVRTGDQAHSDQQPSRATTRVIGPGK